MSRSEGQRSRPSSTFYEEALNVDLWLHLDIGQDISVYQTFFDQNDISGYVWKRLLLQGC